MFLVKFNSFHSEVNSLDCLPQTVSEDELNSISAAVCSIHASVHLFNCSIDPDYCDPQVQASRWSSIKFLSHIHFVMCPEN